MEDDTDESRPSLPPELLEVLMVLWYRFFGISNSVYLPPDQAAQTKDITCAPVPGASSAQLGEVTLVTDTL